VRENISQRRKETNVSETRFIHAYVAGGGRATVAWQPHVFIDRNAVLLGVAWCSPKDHFRKDKGRMIAEGRLSKFPINCKVDVTKREDREFVTEHAVLNAITNQTAGHIVGSVLRRIDVAKVPTWAQDKALFIPTKEVIKVSA